MIKTETATNLLNEHDAVRLEKAGFRRIDHNEEPIGVVVLRDMNLYRKIDDHLLGILERMVWKKGWVIYRSPTPSVTRHPVEISKFNPLLTICADATEREEFEAFLEILEKVES